MLFQFAGLQSEQAATTRNILHQEQDSVLSVATTAQQDTALVTSTPETTAPHTGELFSGVLQTASLLPKTTDVVESTVHLGASGMCTTANLLEAGVPRPPQLCDPAAVDATKPSAAQPSSEVQPSQAQQGYEVS